MMEKIWIYEDKEISEDALILDAYELTDEEREMYEREDKENLASSTNWDEREREKEERNRKYDGGIIIASKIYLEEHKFYAILKNGKIGVFYNNWLFCDYLRNEKELKKLFENIDIVSRRISRSYSEYLDVETWAFGLDEIINNKTVKITFSYGSWFSQNINNENNFGWTIRDEQIVDWGEDIDICEYDRDKLIEKLIEYDNGFVPISRELIIEKLRDKIDRINAILEDYKNKKIGKKKRKKLNNELNDLCWQMQDYRICDQCRRFRTCYSVMSER